MKIKSISFIDNQGKPDVWELTDFNVSDMNLIVAKNGTGKSRSLSIISHLANLIAGRVKVGSGQTYEYNVEFESSEHVTYELKVVNGTIKNERLVVAGDVKISKLLDGKTEIYFDAIKQSLQSNFEPYVVAASQRDSLQKPYLETLYEWASNTTHLRFGTPLGQHVFTAYTDDFEKEFDYKNIESISAYFRMSEVKGNQEQFNKLIISDLNEIGYDVSDVGYCEAGLATPDNKVLHKIYVKENDLNTKTYQEQMSQGMFRAVSILVHINYIYLNDISTCLLIDDIGEGLDFKRSAALINLLCKKIPNSKNQLLMTSNDRFVMNGVALKYWSILTRQGHKCSMINIHNSPEIFEDFEFTGLNNFDFFSTEFYKGENS